MGGGGEDFLWITNATITAKIYRTSLFLSFGVKHCRFSAPLNHEV